jgi:hypothetical protein
LRPKRRRTPVITSHFCAPVCRPDLPLTSPSCFDGNISSIPTLPSWLLLPTHLTHFRPSFSLLTLWPCGQININTQTPTHTHTFDAVSLLGGGLYSFVKYRTNNSTTRASSFLLPSHSLVVCVRWVRAKDDWLPCVLQCVCVISLCVCVSTSCVYVVCTCFRTLKSDDTQGANNPKEKYKSSSADIRQVELPVFVL